MKQIKLNLGLTLVSVLAVSVLAVGPVSAQHGSDDNQTASTTTTTTTEDNTSTSGSGTSGSGRMTTAVRTDDSGSHELNTETEHTQVTDDQTTGSVDNLRAQANKLLSADRQAKKPHSAEDRQKACTARKDELTKKIANYGTQATRHLTSLNTTYSKLTAYQADKKLTVTDFAALTAAADAKKTAATSAVDALKAVTVDIDCTSADPAASVATVKTAVKNARVALQDYHTAVKNVLVALMTAKNASAGTTDNTSNTSTTPDTTKETN